MIPLKDENPTRRPALLTYGLIILNLAIYFYVAQSPVMDAAIVRRYALIPADIAAGRHLGTLLSSLFLHASLLHVGGNMLFLWIFGNNVEDRLGELKYILLYLVAGVAGSLLQVAADPSSQVPTLGASGAISGVLAAYVLFYPRARVLDRAPGAQRLPLAGRPRGRRRSRLLRSRGRLRQRAHPGLAAQAAVSLSPDRPCLRRE